MAEARFLDRTTPPHIATLVLATSVATLSQNFFLPSLPGMAAHFGVEYGVMQLAVSVYLAMTAVMQLVVSPISDRYGRRPVLIAALVLFCLATLGCLLAPNFGVFLACRLAQAVIASVIALSRAVVRDLVDTDRAASLIGWITMGVSIVPMVAPMAGGALDAAFGWKASFVVMLVCGAAMAVLVWADLGETATARQSGFAAQLRGWPVLLRSGRFWGCALAAGFATGAFFAYLGATPYLGAHAFGMTPAGLGFWFGAPALGYLVGNGLSGRYAARVGIVPMMLWGAIVTTAGLAVLVALAAADLAPAAVYFGLCTLIGLGNGMVLPSANAGMLSVEPRLAGSASGLGGAINFGLAATLAAASGWVLSPEGGVLAPALVMAGSSLASVPCVLAVRRLTPRR